MSISSPRTREDGPALLPWDTVSPQRTVLVVAQNVTTLNRLVDVLEIFASDLRVACLVTSDLSDPFADDLPEKVAALGLAALPWSEAVRRPFDLIISASHHGDLAALRGPLVLLPHGNGFAKYAPGQPGPGAGPAGAYGLAPEWVLRGGRPFAEALVLSHPEQLDRLRSLAPAALPAAAVVGDPCFDRMLASRGRRRSYRRALGVPDDRTIVVISSTWGRDGLLGAWPDVVGRLTAELPADAFAPVLVAHPNVWSWHGASQLRSWLADALRAGLVLIPPLLGWQAAVVAADCVIGDHGSVTAYAAGLGTAVLLAAYPAGAVVPGTAVDRLGRLAPRLDPGTGLREQVEGAIAAHDPHRWAPVRDLLTDVPGEALHRLREVVYRALRLPPPPVPATPEPFGCDLPTGSSSATATASVTTLAAATARATAYWVLTAVEADPPRVRIDRFPARLRRRHGLAPPPGAHLAVLADEPDPDLGARAEVVLGDDGGYYGGDGDDDGDDGDDGDDRACGAPAIRELRARFPAAGLHAVASAGGCLVQTSRGRARLRAEGVEPAVLASAAHAWLAAGRPDRASFEVWLGGRRVAVDLSPYV